MCTWLTNYVLGLFGINEKIYKYDAIETLSEIREEEYAHPITVTEDDEDEFCFVEDKFV